MMLCCCRGQACSHLDASLPTTHSPPLPLAHIAPRVAALQDEILFGEWCLARHSVPYTRLPGYFIAFDIFSKLTGRFCSIDERNRRLDGLDIPIVPLIARRRFESRAQLLELLETPSAYYDGFVEGAYLRVDEGEHNCNRGKIVRPDFIQGITTHWQSHAFVKNGLRLG
jgi:atypical dual specificity phosphatase